MELVKFAIIILLQFAGAFASALQGWENLLPGDKIAIIAPSGAPTPQALAKAAELITARGFIAEFPQDLICVQDFNAANTIEYKIEHFLSVLRSDAKAIWAIRGGRGASELFLDPEVFEEFRSAKPKLLIGFSDFTAIHLWANSLGWPSLHGVVLSFCSENEHTVNSDNNLDRYFRILKGQISQVQYCLAKENEFAEIAVIENTTILGGNLSLIQRSIGTSTAINAPAGFILFIEDIGEEGSKLHEALIHLQRASILQNAKAVIWGNFQSKDEEGVAIAKEKFLERMCDRCIPVYSATFFGHGRLNKPLPFNTSARIEGGTLIVRTNNS